MPKQLLISSLFFLLLPNLFIDLIDSLQKFKDLLIAIFLLLPYLIRFLGLVLRKVNDLFSDVLATLSHVVFGQAFPL